MRAAIFREATQPLSIEKCLVPDPSEGEVVVRMVASGVCHSDLSVRKGLLPSPSPAILGHEGSGIVESVGPGVRTVAPGDAVVLVWQAPCRRCPQCLAGQPHLCTDDLRKQRPARITSTEPLHAMNGLGTFAEFALVHERCLVRVDADVDLDVAAVLGCAGLTGIGAAIYTAGVGVGDSVAVVGCGGVGLSAIQGARAAGARQIVAVDPIPEKRDRALRMGATDAISPVNSVKVIADLTDGVGTDHVIDCVGIENSIRNAYLTARIGGTVTVVGVGPLETRLPITIGDFLKPRRLQFSVYGGVDAQRDVPRMLELERRGVLQLQSILGDRIKLSEVNRSLDQIEQGSDARAVIRFDR